MKLLSLVPLLNLLLLGNSATAQHQVPVRRLLRNLNLSKNIDLLPLMIVRVLGTDLPSQREGGGNNTKQATRVSHCRIIDPGTSGLHAGNALDLVDVELTPEGVLPKVLTTGEMFLVFAAPSRSGQLMAVMGNGQSLGAYPVGNCLSESERAVSLAFRTESASLPMKGNSGEGFASALLDCLMAATGRQALEIGDILQNASIPGTLSEPYARPVENVSGTMLQVANLYSASKDPYQQLATAALLKACLVSGFKSRFLDALNGVSLAADSDLYLDDLAIESGLESQEPRYTVPAKLDEHITDSLRNLADTCVTTKSLAIAKMQFRYIYAGYLTANQAKSMAGRLSDKLSPADAEAIVFALEANDGAPDPRAKHTTGIDPETHQFSLTASVQYWKSRFGI